MATIEELNECERSWVESLLDALREAGVDVTDPASLGGFFDDALAAWRARPERDRPDPNPLINLIGAGLGQHLADRCGLRWVIAGDEHGTELALHRADNDILLFPANAVAKRWVDGTAGFIPPFVADVATQISGLSSR
jgi:Domain of unknown function (DUF3806)